MNTTVTMTTATVFDRFAERLAAGERLTAAEIQELSTTPDILSVGMLADSWKRRLHDASATFLRVAESPLEIAFADGVPEAAKELRLTSGEIDFAAAVSAVAALRDRAGDRTVTAFSWKDVERWSRGDAAAVLRELRSAGLDAIAELSLDTMSDIERALASLTSAGFDRLRLTIDKASSADRTGLLLRAGEFQRTHGNIQAISPLPLMLGAFRPTTGYEDVKTVSIARLAAPDASSIQVDWQRYGPKLAQVALTFGADDVYGISAMESAVEGRRRAPLAEIQRNIEAAGLVAVERDGRFRRL